MKYNNKIRMFPAKIVSAVSVMVIVSLILGMSGLYSCGLNDKYFAELKSSYIYDKQTGILRKYPSEITFQPDELLSLKDNKTTSVKYKTLNLTLPKRNYNTGIVYDYNITIAYAVYNGRLVLTQIPMQFAPCHFFTFNSPDNSTDSVIITIDNENAFLVDLSESNAGSFKKLFNDGDFNDYFDENAIKKLIFADIISISPDDKYILYRSNRNYIYDSPASLDLYSYDLQTGTETKIMNFDGKEFLCWEKLEVNPESSGNFLFRDINISKSDGKKTYSDIRRYSLTKQSEDLFLTLASKYSTYEMIDDEYLYVIRSGADRTAEDLKDDETVLVNKNTVLYIENIYSKELKTLDIGKYNMIWDVKISDSRDYLAFFASYININGFAIAEIITLHIDTNNIMPYYEQNVENYYLDSFYWCPDNVLIINFINTVDLYEDLCRFHKIIHKSAD